MKKSVLNSFNSVPSLSLPEAYLVPNYRGQALLSLKIEHYPFTHCAGGTSQRI